MESEVKANWQGTERGAGLRKLDCADTSRSLMIVRDIFEDWVFAQSDYMGLFIYTALL